MKVVVKYMDSVHLTFVVFVKKKEFKAEYTIHKYTMFYKLLYTSKSV